MRNLDQSIFFFFLLFIASGLITEAVASTPQIIIK
jgi:hypothetical protein